MKRLNLDLFVRCFVLLWKPSLHAGIYLVCWVLFRVFVGHKITVDAEWAAAFLAGGYTVHAIFGVLAVMGGARKQGLIEWADAIGDKDTFLFNKGRMALEPPWRVLLIIFTLILLGMSLLAPFEPFGGGIWLVGGGSYMLFGIWAVVDELADPFKGAWTLNSRLIHPEWKDEDPEAYFRQKRRQKEEAARL